MMHGHVNVTMHVHVNVKFFTQVVPIFSNIKFNSRTPSALQEKAVIIHLYNVHLLLKVSVIHKAGVNT
jgi:hypothetical protein